MDRAACGAEAGIIMTPDAFMRAMRQSLLIAAVVAALLRPAAAQAEEWRYCYVGSDERHAFYMSRAFKSDAAMAAIETRFLAWLREHRLPDEAFGCPRSESRLGIEAVMRDAADYNTRTGRKPTDLDWPSAGR